MGHLREFEIPLTPFNKGGFKRQPLFKRHLAYPL